MPPPKPSLTQAEFDDAVATNREDFDMSPEEAVAAAIEEFELQGYSLEGVIKTVSGGNTDSHPVALATRALSNAANNAAGVELERLAERVVALQQLLRGASGDELQAALAVAAKEGSVAVLLAAAKAGLALRGSGGEASPHALLLPCLRAARLLMQSPGCRAAFLAEGGPDLLQQLLRGCNMQLDALQAAADAEQAALTQAHQLAAPLAALAEAAAWQDEEAKCRCMPVAASIPAWRQEQDAPMLRSPGPLPWLPRFVDMGVAEDLLQLLRLLGRRTCLAAEPAAVAAAGAAAGALRAFTTADDERPPASKAFMHARLLAGKPHHALQALLPVLQQLQLDPERPVSALIAVLAAVRQVAANDEICKAFAEAGGVGALHELLGAASTAGPPELVRATAGALRQLANSDGIKQQLAEAGALRTLLRSVRAYAGHLGAQEHLLGLLVALVLRMPGIAAAAAEAGGVDVLTEVLAAAPAMAAEAKAAAGATAAVHQALAQPDSPEAGEDAASRVFGVAVSSGGSSNAAAVQRQACMAVRNMAVRNPELRPAFLAAGAEELLRAVKPLFPSACRDVAGAALRDLGLDNYNA